MPYKDGKVYVATVNGKTYGASHQDIAKALNTTKLDTGSLCTNPNIKMWAMFKPMVHTGPQPYTNAERRLKSWGLELPMKKPTETPSLSALPYKWGYARPTDWYNLNDFVGENEYEGYAPGAEPVVTVQMQRANNGVITVYFYFNDGTDGGIPPSELIVPKDDAGSTGDTTMAELYPGVIIYLESSDGYFSPRRIITMDKKVKEKKNGVLSMSVTLSFIGTGTFAIVPIFSRETHILGKAPSDSMARVLPAHDAMLELPNYDSNVGTGLFTRRDIGLNQFGVNVGNGFFKYDGSIGWRDNADGTLHNYYWIFNQSSALTLRPQSEMVNLQKTDKRLMVTLTFLTGASNDYGIGSWVPRPLIYNSSDFNEEIKREYRYSICTWQDPADGDDVYLVLRFVPDKNNSDWAGATSLQDQNWQIAYRRSLVLLDSNGNLVGSGAISDEGDVSIIGYGSTIKKINVGTPIKQLRFGNIITSNGSFNSVSGVYLNGTPFSSGVWAISTDSGSLIKFNDTSANIPNMYRMPVETQMYVDITVDTPETVKENPLFN